MIEAIPNLTILEKFQLESNMIERIEGTTTEEIAALARFIFCDEISIADLVAYVRGIQPDAKLRNSPVVHGVRVSQYIAPASGPELMFELNRLLYTARFREASILTPFQVYCRYENLHPFTDGNGRSGRALWLWMRHGNPGEGFLRSFHYEALEDHTVRMGR